MQLKHTVIAKHPIRRIGRPLAAATAALLGVGAGTELVAQELERWEFDTAMLYYGESDSRVQDFSLNALVRKEIKEDSFLSLSLAIDALTGASPSGAVASNQLQTFTRPSGNDEYTVAPGQQPLDDTFQDTRTALSANWDQPLGRLMRLNLGASFSDEYDYTHTGFNVSLARDFNNRNTTLSAGVAAASDTLNSVGGSPVGLSPMLGVGDLSNRLGDQDKDVTDILLGVTQVINRQTLVQFNYSLSQSDGYLSDPYKILSVVDEVTGLPVAGPVASGRNLYLYERRPNQRDKQSMFALVKRDFSGDVLDASYRYMTDDWGIDSHTFDIHYRWKYRSDQYLEPHIRIYSQNQADFFHTVLFDGRPVPNFASADYRLGKFNALTVGLKYGRQTGHGEMSTRIELYRQTGDAEIGSAIGALATLDLYPDLTAVIAQFSYKFGG